MALLVYRNVQDISAYSSGVGMSNSMEKGCSRLEFKVLCQLEGGLSTACLDEITVMQ